MNIELQSVALVNPENIKRTVALAERSIKECWAKLVMLQSETATKQERFESFISFQSGLFSALFELESCYNEVCAKERELISKKTIAKSIFKGEMERIAKYKGLLDGIIDIGKSLGDAFAWIFYLRNRRLLRKHYEHEFIPRLPTRIGGKGVVEFIKKHQMFGRYFVLSHAITTFLREGDVSLIDPSSLQVAALGEIKTQKISETEISTSIYIIGERKLPKSMLPPILKRPRDDQASKTTWDTSFVERLKKQINSMEKLFKESKPVGLPEKIKMSLPFAKLDQLFKESSKNEWGHVRVGQGLMLIGIRCDESSWADQVVESSTDCIKVYERNLAQIPSLAVGIVDKNLPDNGLIVGSMFYPAKGRYELELKMRPLFWWHLGTETREAIIFKRMVVMTLYNPAFLSKALREAGFDAQFHKKGGLKIFKKYGIGQLQIIGINYLYKLVQTHLLSEETIVTMIQKSVEKVEKAKIKQTTCVSIDFDFRFQ
jgi:hypothetical protein